MVTFNVIMAKFHKGYAVEIVFNGKVVSVTQTYLNVREAMAKAKDRAQCSVMLARWSKGN